MSLPAPGASWRALPLGLLAACSAPSSGQDRRHVAEFKYSGRQIFVPVQVGVLPPMDFLLDTGATGSAISIHVARRLGLDFAGLPTAEIRTAGGKLYERYTVLPLLRIGAIEVKDVSVTIMPMNQLREAGHDVDGLIGNDVLERFELNIDYRRRLVMLTRRA